MVKGVLIYYNYQLRRRSSLQFRSTKSHLVVCGSSYYTFDFIFSYFICSLKTVFYLN